MNAMIRWFRIPGSALALAAVAAAACAADQAACVRRDGPAIVLGNKSLELAFECSEGGCRLVRLVNKLAACTHALAADDFAIGVEGRPKPLAAAAFAFRDAKDEPVPGGRRLVLHFDGKTPGISLDVIYELGDADFFCRRRLELATGKPLALRQVDAWLVGIDGKCSHQGFGNPVLLDDTFWGLEFPAAHNQHADGRVRLTQFPGRSVTGKFTSKTAVVGVAERGRVVPRFRRYVESFQVTPKERNLFVNYNTWWTLMPPDEKNCLALIDVFQKKLFDPYGESFDTFTIDDGWDNKDSIWEIRKGPFPRGFAPLVEALKKMNANLGLWLSPSSGYSHAPWGGRNGYELNSNPWFLCQSGPKYRAAIVPVVTGLARTYDMAFFKFDGFSATCDAAGHGHLPGDYAREANVDAYIELLSAVRETRKDVFLDPTCGMWLSPWWLRYVDSIWGSVSGDYPDIIVPAPIIRDSATTTRDGAFRQRCQEHPGYPPAGIEHLGIIVITPEKWEDNAMIVLGRGCRLLTLYINPEFFKNPDRDWAFLASILKWVRHHKETLAQTELILGDPMKREPYGYAHFVGPRGIIALRNPFIEPKKVAVKLDESSGWERPAAPSLYTARIVYPRHEGLPKQYAYGASLEMELQGYETVIVQVEPVNAATPVLPGRCCEVARQGNQITYAVYQRQGDKRPCSVEGGKIEAVTTDAAWKITGACTARVPQGTKAAMYVMFEPGGSYRGAPKCTVQVAGRPVPVRAVLPPKQAEQTHSAHTWTWFAFDVPEGESQVSVAIEPAPDAKGGTFFRGEIGWWLWAEHPLAKYTLTKAFDAPLPPVPNDPLPLPIAQDRQRQIVTIHPAGVVRAGNRWPGLEKPVVRLDEIAPDECQQDWGKLERNRSVWEKEMIVAGRKFAHGLGTHAGSRIVYELSGGRFKQFRCQVGRDEHAMDGQVVFQVWVDGQKRFDSGPMRSATPAKPVNVDLTGATLLELRTLTGEDGLSGDHGDWAEAELVR
jgi:hypothetical protein